MARVDAPAGFAARVMARAGRRQLAEVTWPSRMALLWWQWLRRRAVASSFACLVVLAVGLGLASWERHTEMARRQEQLRGEQAGAQLLLAVRIAGTHLARVHELLSDAQQKQPAAEQEQDEPRLTQ
jgi:hypothetical protein